MDEFHKDALKYQNSLQPKRSKIVEEKHEDKIQDEEVHKTSPLTKLPSKCETCDHRCYQKRDLNRHAALVYERKELFATLQ